MDLTGIGEKISLVRKKAGLRQMDLARLMEVSISTIQKYEYGDLLPSLSFIADLCTTFNVNFYWLVDVSDEPDYSHYVESMGGRFENPLRKLEDLRKNPSFVIMDSLEHLRDNPLAQLREHELEIISEMAKAAHRATVNQLETLAGLLLTPEHFGFPDDDDQES